MSGWLDLPVAGGAALLSALSASVLFRRRGASQREAAIVGGASRRETELLQTLHELIVASRDSPLAVRRELDRALRARLATLCGTALFERCEDRLVCIFTSGERCARLADLSLTLDDGNLVAHAVRLRHRTLAIAPQRGLDPSHRVSLAIPMVSGDHVQAVLLLVAPEGFEPGGIEAAVELVEQAAPLYLLACEREADRSRAMLDGLTGLLTPAAFRMLLRREIERAAGMPGRRLALLFVDTDHFKEFNDSHGHGAGDVLLRRVAALLQESAGPGDIVARNGGDEFCVVFVEAEKTQAVERAVALGRAIAGRATLGLCEPRWSTAAITASIGVAAFPSDARSAEELLERADAAMYHSKRAGRDRVSYYDVSGALVVH